MMFNLFFKVFLANDVPVAQLDTCLPAGSNSPMYQVYAIRSEKDGRIYVGMTSDFKRRMKEHELGMTKATKGFRPWKLLYSVDVKDRVEARALEKKWKSGFGKEFLKNIKVAHCPSSSVG